MKVKLHAGPLQKQVLLLAEHFYVQTMATQFYFNFKFKNTFNINIKTEVSKSWDEIDIMKLKQVN